MYKKERENTKNAQRFDGDSLTPCAGLGTILDTKYQSRSLSSLRFSTFVAACPKGIRPHKRKALEGEVLRAARGSTRFDEGG